MTICFKRHKRHTKHCKALRGNQPYVSNKNSKEPYVSNKNSKEPMQERDCLCSGNTPCRHNNIGDNTCFALQMVNGQQTCPAGTTYCVNPLRFTDNTFVADCAGSIETALAGGVQTCPSPGAMRM